MGVVVFPVGEPRKPVRLEQNLRFSGGKKSFASGLYLVDRFDFCRLDIRTPSNSLVVLF
jgi:hypothetical protein